MKRSDELIRPSLPRALRISGPVLVLALAACGGAAPRGGGDDPTRLEPRRLFPMGEGYSWAYENDPGMGLPRQTSVLRVSSYDSGGARVESLATGDARSYELRADGLYWVDAGVYLLRSPITLGAEWPSANGRTARVSDVDASVDVPTGHFDHCVEIREEGGESGLAMRTVYCPDVGPTLIEAHQTLSLSASGVTATGRLQAYQLGEDEEE